MNNKLPRNLQDKVSVPYVMLGLLLVIFLAAVEQTIVAVALPGIAADLRGIDLVAWVVSVYLVASTVSTPIYGKLSDTYGRRSTMTSAILIFLVASVGCALSKTMPQLIAFRLLQGFGGGGLISVAQAAIADVVSLRERGRYQGYISAVWLVASTGGPIAGGYLTKYLSWPWIFWINVPFSLVALAVMRNSLRSLRFNPVRRRIDYVGALLFGVGTGAVLVAITGIGEGVPLMAPHTVSLLAAAVLTLAVFFFRSANASDPIIPLKILRNRTVAICCAVQFIAYFEMLSALVLMPLRLEIVGGVTVEIAAVRLLPMTLAVPVGAFAAGHMMSKTGRYKPLQLAGAVAVMLALGMLAFIETRRIPLIGILLALLGLGIGLQFPTSMVATQNAVPHSQVGMATALASFSRMLGGAVGVAALTAILFSLMRDGVHGASGAQYGFQDLLSILQHSSPGSRSPTVSFGSSAEIAFKKVFFIGAIVSLASPILLFKLDEADLRSGAGLERGVE